MDKSKLKIVLILLVVVVGFFALFYWLGGDDSPGGSPVATTTPDNGNGTDNGGLPDPVGNSMIRVTSPLSGLTVSSPLRVTGEARGGWYFEADFPVRVLDANGRELGSAPAQAQGEWMTNDFVPFIATVTFSTSTTATGTLVLERSNPSGLPENAAEVRIPIRFSQTSAAQRSLVLYYYNEDKDKDASGNIICSSQGLVAVERRAPVTLTPIQDTIKLLLRGELTLSEKARGITTEFPLPGVELSGANLAGGVLTLSFNDPGNRTSGGSCRAGILWAQIQATAKQFSGVDTVRFQPEELFQP